MRVRDVLLRVNVRVFLVRLEPMGLGRGTKGMGIKGMNREAGSSSNNRDKQATWTITILTIAVTCDMATHEGTDSRHDLTNQA